METQGHLFIEHDKGERQEIKVNVEKTKENDSTSARDEIGDYNRVSAEEAEKIRKLLGVKPKKRRVI
jgi:hypothetical protein